MAIVYTSTERLSLNYRAKDAIICAKKTLADMGKKYPLRLDAIDRAKEDEPISIVEVHTLRDQIVIDTLSRW